MAGLPAEQQPIAEQVVRGGIPAVRRAVEEQNKTRAEGTPEINAAPLVAIAEQVLPAIRSAEWRDKADAAKANLGEVSLRDLRSIVSGAELAREEESRLLAADLRTALDERVAKMQDEWISSITSALDDKKVIRALKAATRAPAGSNRFPADLAVRLAGEASAALAPTTPPREWLGILEAAAESPVRRSVKPVGLPAQDTETTGKAAAQHAGRVPALAALLGIRMPPPPGPVRRAPRPGAIPPPPTTPPPATPPAPPVSEG
ncbi:MAG: hypothetical protein ACR2H3_17060 [Acidimicrobiales bacterium]